MATGIDKNLNGSSQKEVMSYSSKISNTLVFCLALVFAGYCQISSAALAQYDFTGSDTAAPSPAAANVTWGNFTRNGGLSAIANANTFNSGGWAKPASASQYVSFIIQANSGFGLTLTDMSFIGNSGSTGPNTFTVQILVNGTAVQTSGSFNTGAASQSFNFTDINSTQQSVEFRFFGDSASSVNANDTMFFDQVVINGSVSAVPEPAHYALAIFGLIFTAGSIGHSRFLRLFRQGT